MPLQERNEATETAAGTASLGTQRLVKVGQRNANGKSCSYQGAEKVESMRDHPLVLLEGVGSLSRTEVGLPKVEERLYVERQQYLVYELEGEAIEGAESSVGSPREGGRYRLTNEPERSKSLRW